MKTPKSSPRRTEFDRRGFLKTVAGAAAFTATSGFLEVPRARGQSATQRNLILFITDQERAIQWFPPGWAATNLPATQQLRDTGVSFDRCCANAAMCSPSRNTLFTGLFPAQHQSFDTLTEDFSQSLAEHQLDPAVPNLATVLKGAGYDVVYKGKWHMSKRVENCDGTYTEDDIARYGFDGWDPPDAGQDVKIENYGGGTADNDQRFIDDAVAFLQEKAANPGSRPFCLVISLVNPHDVLGYPGNQGTGGYGPTDLLGDVEIPPTVTENLLTNFKPTAHEALLLRLNGLGPIVTDQQRRSYVNFYANLMKIVDDQMGQILDVFTGAAGLALRDNTWIVRTSDHGEMGMCHGGLRQKSFMCYEEVVRVPLIWSNPIDFPAGRTSDKLVSHVDLLPTICATLGVPGWQGYNFSGIDYSSLIQSPVAPDVQDYLLFTFDDIYAGQNAVNSPAGIVPPPNRIQMIREKEFKYARYFDAAGVQADQQEFYDLRPTGLGGTDYDDTYGQPLELSNLSVWAEAIRIVAGQAPIANATQIAKRTQMSQDLPNIVAARLQPRPAGAPVAPQNFQTQLVGSDVQISWISRSTTQYQLQQTTDGKSWYNVGTLVVGNNGPMTLCQPNDPSVVGYRLAWNAVGVAGPASEIAAPPAPTLDVRGKNRIRISKNSFALHGSTNTVGNEIQYKIRGKGGRTAGMTTSKFNWNLSIKGIPRGRSTLMVRAVNSAGVATDWQQIKLIRE